MCSSTLKESTLADHGHHGVFEAADGHKDVRNIREIIFQAGRPRLLASLKAWMQLAKKMWSQRYLNGKGTPARDVVSTWLLAAR